ncbi:putative histidine kinase 6 [Ceratocystis fimbriata CBS 114723]|uniref:Putative histidine kinase 6 n=1 Tax=Ceratocystis fimbriata CBS 114723 TaxID=1035309 RepID=A0A2C5XIM3_9PEZI|nr:putative histidine kinase 6 [Ceratocystis fimbriata CBS 114723]
MNFTNMYNLSSDPRPLLSLTPISSAVAPESTEKASLYKGTVPIAPGQLGDASKGDTSPQPYTYLPGEDVRKFRPAPGFRPPSPLPSPLASPSAAGFAENTTLQCISAFEFLEHDPRPAFAIDLARLERARNHAHTTYSLSLCLTYANPALRQSRDLSDAVLSPPAATESSTSTSTGRAMQFQKWALQSPGNNPDQQSNTVPYIFQGMTWTAIVLKSRYRVISSSSAMPNTPSPPNASSSQPDLFPDHKIQPALQYNRTSFDWTQIQISDDMPPHMRTLRSVDWAQTALGPITGWSQTLRAMANMIISTAHPAMLFWGRDLVLIYNEAYKNFLGDMHPQPLGRELENVPNRRYHRFKPFLLAVLNKGEGILKHEELNRVLRNGRMEDVYVTWSMAAAVGEAGTVEGVIAWMYETTPLTLRRRREFVLRNMMDETRKATSMDSFWAALVRGFKGAQDEVTFALLYSLKSKASVSQASEILDREPASPKYPPGVMLEGTLGVPEGHPVAARKADLDGTDTGFAPYLRQAMARQSLMMFSKRDNTLASGLVENLDVPDIDTVVVLPIELDSTAASIRAQLQLDQTAASDLGGRVTLGFVVLGLNPHRRLDAAYTQFFQTMCSQLRISATQFTSLEVLLRQGQEEAHKLAQGHSELEKRVIYLKKMFNEREHKYSRMVEFLPVGLFTASASGVIIFCNNMWAQMSQHDKNSSRAVWFDSVCDEDRSGVEALWKKLLGGADALTHEFRLKPRPPRSETGETYDSAGTAGGHCPIRESSVPQSTWVLLNAYPLRRSTSTTALVFGCITDISAQKEAEAFQARQRQEAMKEKQRQDRFIDMTSHEMRNPLGVIMQSADEITTGLAALRAGAATTRTERTALLDSFAAAAEAITLCVNHQTSIVNDVLMLSKMDANLLHVAPVAAQPLQVVREVLRMHEPQLLAAGIRLSCVVDDSMMTTGLAGWAMFDPMRLRQVLINFMTNAIKFTSGQPRKSVTVQVAAAYDNFDGSPASGSYSSALTLDKCPLITGTNFLPPRPENISQFPSASDSSNPSSPSAGSCHFPAASQWGSGRTINLVISVTDTGPGLSPSAREQLFQRFWQASPRTHVTYGGSGLGLFISRNLVELQGGRVGVASDEGVGATFTFYIKMKQCNGRQPAVLRSAAAAEMAAEKPPLHIVGPNNAAAVAAVDSACTTSAIEGSQKQLHASTKTLRDGSTTSRPPKFIMYVEDNTVNAALAKRQLEKLGSIVRIARHGAEALEQLRGSRFWAANGGSGFDIGVILMDLEMPVMDGKECTRQIRALERDGSLTRRLLIIAVTAYTRPAVVEEMAQLGMDGVIAKPFRMGELIAKVNSIIAVTNGSGAQTATPPSVPKMNLGLDDTPSSPPTRKPKRPTSLTIPYTLYPPPPAQGASSHSPAPKTRGMTRLERPRPPAHMPSTPNLGDERSDLVSESGRVSDQGEACPRRSLSSRK